MHYDILTYDGKSFSDFKCWWDGSQVFSRVGREIEKFSINGRSGDLTISKRRFPNTMISYNCFIKENFRNNYAALLDFLNNQVGYKQLRSTEEPNMFRLALFHANTEPVTTPFNQAGQFTLEFDCDPRLFLDEGQKELPIVNNQIRMLNPTYSPATPLVKITNRPSASGTSKISFPSGAYVEIDAGLNDYPIYVDFGEAIEAYCMINDTRLDINRYITVSGTIDGWELAGKAESIMNFVNIQGAVIPRWYRL